MNLNEALLKISQDNDIKLYTASNMHGIAVCFEIRSPSGGVQSGHSICYIVKPTNLPGLWIRAAIEMFGDASEISELQYTALEDFIKLQNHLFKNIAVYDLDGGDMGRGTTHYMLGLK